jgi:hypothetical protein
MRKIVLDYRRKMRNIEHIRREERQMFRKIDNHKQTASFNAKKLEIVVMYDDGFEDILDYRTACANEDEARAYFDRNGFEEYDPNAELKAQGFVFKNGIYQKAAA